MKKKLYIILGFIALMAIACSVQTDDNQSEVFTFLPNLSDYGFFEGKITELQPVESVFAYELNSPLFTDYAYKARFIKLPEGEKMQYQGGDLPVFPDGTVLIKNFYYLNDERKPEEGKRIIETRLLVLDEGTWKVGTYIWNDEQTDAYHELLGQSEEVSWTNKEGKVQKITYQIPDNNDCKSCHKRDGIVAPIGPKVRNLNVDLPENGKNQLKIYAASNRIEGLPENMGEVEKLPVWDDETFSLEERARAYLEINCAHCHSNGGPANNTALNLNYEEEDLHKLGFCKGPISAAQGSGDLRFDIVPGNAEASIVHFRMNSTETGIAMPEIGKSLVHTEGVALIKAWIDSMEDGDCQ